MSKSWRFAQNSLGSHGHHHNELLLMNDPEPVIQCAGCGKRWTLLPDGVIPKYDHPGYEDMLDNTAWADSMRDKRVEIKP